MADYLDQNVITLAKRLELIRAVPCFANLTASQYEELATLLQVVHYIPNEVIVTEHEIVDSVYIIVYGKAEVTRAVKKTYTLAQVPVAVLNAGEVIGLNDTGFYSATGHRTATVTAVTNVLALRLDVKDLYEFLQKNKLESRLYATSLQMLRMQLIKSSLPFATLSPERLQWLADKVEDEIILAGNIIFRQGDAGDKCYLIRTGQVEILIKDEHSVEKRIALLKSPSLFGEATLITNEARNATARAFTDVELLTLRHEYLSELIETEQNVARIFMNLMVDRSRPIQNPHVTAHQRLTADGEEITILKSLDNHSYFKLSKEGRFIWEQLNGKHTLQEVTLALADKFGVFAPDMVAAIISKLAKAKFIVNLEVDGEDISRRPFVIRILSKLRKFAEMRIAFGDADLWITKIYQKYIRYLFTKPAQLALAFIAMLGFFAFVFNTEDVLLFFSFKHASLLLLLGLIPLSLVAVILHELGHAFAVKAFNQEVHYMGIGWFWLMPIAFTDTSDMWLATRKPRMLVNLAGIYVDVLVAGLAALGMYITDNPYVQGMLWLFSLYAYIHALRMLSPLQELDGYYVLMDWVEKNRLRQSAIRWLLKDFPKCIRQPRLFREYKPEIIYWLACLTFIILISVVTLVVQGFVFNIFGIEPAKSYLVLLLPVIVAILSSLGIVADIRRGRD